MGDGARRKHAGADKLTPCRTQNTGSLFIGRHFVEHNVFHIGEAMQLCRRGAVGAFLCPHAFHSGEPVKMTSNEHDNDGNRTQQCKQQDRIALQ